MIVVAALLVALAAPPAAAPPQPHRACLMLANSSSTSYHPVDDHTIVIEDGSRWFKLTTTPSSLMLTPDTYFVNEIRGTSTLCSRLDFDLSVVDRPSGAREPLIVQEFTAITPEEGRALAKRSRR